METSRSELAIYAQELVDVTDRRNLSRDTKMRDVIEILETVVRNAERRGREHQEESDKQAAALASVRERCR